MAWKKNLGIAGVILGLVAGILIAPQLPGHPGRTIGQVIANMAVLGLLFFGIGALIDHVFRSKKRKSTNVMLAAGILIIFFLLIIALQYKLFLQNRQQGEELSEAGMAQEEEASPADTGEPAETVPSEREEKTGPEEEKAALSRIENDDIGLSATDFPGYMVISAERKGLSDIPKAAQENMQAIGFISAFSVTLQKPPLASKKRPGKEFREIQSTVWTFSDRAGAERFFDAIYAGYAIKLAGIEIGENATFHMETYEDEDGLLEQHYLVFLLGKRVGMASTTAREDAGMGVDLVHGAARKLEAKMQ